MDLIGSVGRKHLLALIDVVKAGHRAAMRSGVEVYARRAAISLEAVGLADPVDYYSY